MPLNPQHSDRPGPAFVDRARALPGDREEPGRRRSGRPEEKGRRAYAEAGRRAYSIPRRRSY
ncbi:hypothetical protein ACPCSC_23310 [Streptomyces lavendulocolor]|uniref:hypothetical protein n=1 Tax=Streptomyces lavendulocolor TaxID=67316 RepID=UPI003C2C8B2D